MLTTTDARRAGSDGDEFQEPHLRFRIRKPPGWRFLPPSWSPAAQMRRIASQADWARHARLPFVVMAREGAEGQLRPLIQVTCRPAGPHDPPEIRRLLASQLEFLSGELEEFERLASSFDCIVAGHRAAHVRYRHTLRVRAGGSVVPVRLLARSYLVPTPGMAFTIAMSTGSDAHRGDEADFEAALSSIRIGRHEGRPSPTSRPRPAGGSAPRRSSS